MDSRHRFQVLCNGRATVYWQLLRTDRPDVPGVPVAMALGKTEPFYLIDSIPARQRAFFTLKKTLISDAGDYDLDGISDATELQNLPGMNPFNPARSISDLDGAICITSRAQFDGLSHRDSFPGAPNVRELKFLVRNVDTNKPELYFLNNNRHIYHYYFAQQVLGYPNSLTVFNNETYFTNVARKNVAGSIVVHENYQPAGGGPKGLYTMEFWPSDPVSYPFVQKTYDLLTKSLPYLETRMAYHAASETQRTLYRTEKTQFTAAEKHALHVIKTEDLFGQVTYSMLNQGVGFGRLVVAETAGPLSARDVVIFRNLPNDITHLGGIITAVVQTPLSHVNLKAKQNNTPNAFIKDPENNPLIQPLLGRNVRYETLPDGFTIREATQEEVEANINSTRPTTPVVPVRDLTKTTIKPLSQLGFADYRAYGSKASNVAELRKFLPSAMVPNGSAIPFYFYDEFMKANDLYTFAQNMMAMPEFQTDPEVRSQWLAGMRSRIRGSFIPLSLYSAMTTLQNSFPVGTPLRCRSSTNNEDLAGFNGAGLYDSYTHRPDEGHLSKTITQVWAGLWTDRAFDEREFYRVDHLKTAMGVLVHPNYDDEQSNGVGVTRNLIDPNWRGYYVNAQLGENLVTNPSPGDRPEEFLIAELLGATPYEIQYVTFSNLLPEGQTVLTRAQAELLANQMKLIQSRFYPLYGYPANFAMEIEFKFDRLGNLVIKQARPWVE